MSRPMKHLAAFKFGLRDLFWLPLSVALTILLIKNHFENSATQDALREENSIHEVKTVSYTHLTLPTKA